MKTFVHVSQKNQGLAPRVKKETKQFEADCVALDAGAKGVNGRNKKIGREKGRETRNDSGNFGWPAEKTVGGKRKGR